MGIRVYYTDVSELFDEQLYNLAMALVGEERRKKVEGYRLLKDRCLSLGAGLLLRLALFDFGINEIQDISYGSSGKPYLKDFGCLYFNLSHSHHMAMCAIAVREIGCDIERIGKARENIADRAFSELEKKALFEDDEKDRAFYRIWTMKESYVKATGSGMSMGFENFTVPYKNISSDDNTCGYIFYEHMIDEEFCSAVCIKEKKTEKIEYYMIKPSEIMDILKRS